MKYIITILMAFITILNSQGHALWIKTDISGKIGKQHKVEIFYEEFADGTREDVKDWYSDVKEFRLWLISPSGEKTELVCNAGTDRFTTSFTPDREGTYTLEISHEARDLGGTTKYQFNAQALVNVRTKELKPGFTENELTTWPESLSYKADRKVNIKSLLKGEENSDIRVTVFSPTGWNKVFSPDDKGVITFTPIWKGDYIIESTHYNGAESGSHGDQSYESVWRCATMRFHVK